MKKCIIIITVIFGLITGISSTNDLFAQSPGKGWTLRWTDEFNGTDVDTTKWEIWDNKPRKDKIQTCYERENVSVSGGILRLKIDNKGSDCPDIIYTGGYMQNKGMYYWNMFGYFEARIRYNLTGSGFWGNFWMNSSQGWPPEFDIAECATHKPDQMPMGYHYYDSAGVHKSSMSFPEVDWKQFHVYAVEWLPNEPVRFYIDGVKVFEPEVTSKYPPNEPMHLILRMGIGSKSWGGIPDEKTVFPGYAEYDWVRVWEKTGIDPTTKIVDP